MPLIGSRAVAQDPSMTMRTCNYLVQTNAGYRAVDCGIERLGYIKFAKIDAFDITGLRSITNTVVYT
jgi:hypothetical protein